MSYQKFNYELLRFHHIYTKDSFDKEIKEIFLKLVPNFKRWERQSFMKIETKKKMQNYMNRFSLGDLRVSFIKKVDPVKNLVFVNKYVGLGKALAKMQDEVLKEYPKVKKPYNLYCRVENKDYHGEKINELTSKMLNKDDFDFNNMSCDCYGRGREIFWRVGLKGNAAKAYGKDKLGICVLFAESDHEGVIADKFGKLFSNYPEDYLYYLSSKDMFISVTPDYFNILGYRHYY